MFLQSVLAPYGEFAYRQFVAKFGKSSLIKDEVMIISEIDRVVLKQAVI